MYIIRKREEFLKMPSGTIYQEIGDLKDADTMNGLRIKADNIGPGFNYFPMWSPVDLELSLIDVPEGKKDLQYLVENPETSWEIDYRETMRNGMNNSDEEVCYAIYEKEDVAKLVAFLQACSGAAGIIEQRREHAVSEDVKNLVTTLYKEYPDLRKEVRTLKSQLKAPYFLSAVGAYSIGAEPTKFDLEAIDNISRTFTRMLINGGAFSDRHGIERFVDFLAGSCGLLVNADPDLVKIFSYAEVPDIKFSGLKAMTDIRPNRKPGE